MMQEHKDRGQNQRLCELQYTYTDYVSGSVYRVQEHVFVRLSLVSIPLSSSMYVRRWQRESKIKDEGNAPLA